VGGTAIHTDQALDRTSSVPLYYQLFELLKTQLERGLWSAGDALPTEQDLCEMYGVSRTTARAALADLVHQGMIQRERGRGTFAVGRRYHESFIQSFGSFHQEMSSRGHQVTSDVLTRGIVAATEEIAHVLQIPLGTSVIHVARLRRLNGEAVVHSTTYMPYALAPAVLDADLSTESLYAFIERTYGFVPARIMRTVEALPLDPAIAETLGDQPGVPALHVESLARLHDATPLEFSDAWYRSENIQFEVEVIVEHRA
jgi:GntR family transcriptional regulator